MDFGKFGNCLEGRLYAIRKDKKLNQKEFGRKIGVTRSAICNYESGTRPVGEQVILAVCREFSVSDEWMRHGVGEPYVAPQNGIIDQLIKEFKCTKFEGDFLKAYFQMSETERLEYVKCVYRLFSPLMGHMQGFNPFAPYFAATYGVDSIDELTADPSLGGSTSDIDVDREVASYREELLLQKEAEAGSSASDGRNASVG